MEPQLIKITEYCTGYDITPDFLESLEESGVIVLTVVGNDKFIHEDQFVELERYIHLHYDLQINVEGIDAIRHLLTRLDFLKNEINQLKSQIHIFPDSL